MKNCQCRSLLLAWTGNQAGLETIEWVAMAAVISILLILIMGLTSSAGSAFASILFEHISSWALSIGGGIASGPSVPASSGGSAPTDSELRLAILFVGTLIVLLIVSRFFGRPWERDLGTNEPLPSLSKTTTQGALELGQPTSTVVSGNEMPPSSSEKTQPEGKQDSGSTTAESGAAVSPPEPV